MSRGSLPMWQFNKNATFSSIDLIPVTQDRPLLISENFKTIMALMAAKVFHVPQPFRIFGVSEIEDAFRLFQSGRNAGKMAIEMRKHEQVRVCKPEREAAASPTDINYIDNVENETCLSL